MSGQAADARPHAGRPESPSMSPWTLRFVEVVMSVIAGALLLDTPRFLVGGFTPTNWRGLMLIMALLIFLELYLVLIKYHRMLELTYAPFFLFLDCLAGLLFVYFVELVKQSETQPAYLGQAMIICGVVFVLLAIRQLISYHRVDHLEARLDTIEIQKKDLVFPIIADGFGVVLCLCILLADRYERFLLLGVVGWCWVGVFGIAVYFDLVYVLKFDWGLSVR